LVNSLAVLISASGERRSSGALTGFRRAVHPLPPSEPVGKIFLGVRLRILDEKLVLDHCLRLATSSLRHLSFRNGTVVCDLNHRVVVVHVLITLHILLATRYASRTRSQVR
jgi:hypothetical protein